MSSNDPGGVLGPSATPPSLVEGMQRGDEEAWQRFMASYGENLRTWLGKLLGPYKDQDLDDLYNEFFLRVFRQWPKVDYQPKRSFKGWLVTTAKHTWLDVVRARTRNAENHEQGSINWHQVEDQSLGEADLDFDSSHEDLLREAEAIVKQIVSEQEWQCYECVVLRCHTIMQTAEKLGLSKSTVSRHKIKVFELVRAKARELGGFD